MRKINSIFFLLSAKADELHLYSHKRSHDLIHSRIFYLPEADVCTESPSQVDCALESLFHILEP